MRNEIFNRINQNKIQYYSELKNDETDTTKKMGSLPNEKKIINEYLQRTGNQSRLTQQFNRSKISLHMLVFKNIRQQLSNLASQAKDWILNTHLYFANKVAIQSNKLTDGLTRISSQLFEDRYEYHESNHLDRQIGNQSINFSLLNTSRVTSSLTFESNKLSLQDLLFDWLNKMCRNIIIFLESDDWLDEINRSQKSTLSAPEKHETVSHNSNIAKFRLFISGISKKGVQHHSISNENTVTYRENGKDYYRIFIREFKNLSAKLFPSINRFI